MMNTKIGTLTLSETYKHVPSQESAAAHDVVEVPAGEYNILIKRDQYGQQYVVVALEGVLVYSSYLSRLGGASSFGEKRPMTPWQGSVSVYGYELKSKVSGDKVFSDLLCASTVKMDEGFESLLEAVYP